MTTISCIANNCFPVGWREKEVERRISMKARKACAIWNSEASKWFLEGCARRSKDYQEGRFSEMPDEELTSSYLLSPDFSNKCISLSSSRDAQLCTVVSSTAHVSESDALTAHRYDSSVIFSSSLFVLWPFFFVPFALYPQKIQK